MMQELINKISLVEWIIFSIAVIALFVSLMAWRRAGKLLKLVKQEPATEVKQIKPSVKADEEQQPDVRLEITADKNEFDQVTLIVKNSGLLSANKINISIETPTSIYDAEELSGGLEVANVTESSVILPRLAILDVEKKLPIQEIKQNGVMKIPSALTMAHGKICEFPVTLNWLDGNGMKQKMQSTLTI